jgi:hypothetical protein
VGDLSIQQFDFNTLSLNLMAVMPERGNDECFCTPLRKILVLHHATGERCAHSLFDWTHEHHALQRDRASGGKN